MSALSDPIEEFLARVRRRSRAQVVARAAMAACGILAQTWVAVSGDVAWWGWLGAAALAVGVALPRTAAPLLGALVIVIEAVVADVSVVAAVPLTVLLLGWHACASLLSTGRPWSRLRPSVLRAARTVTATALAVTAVTAAIAFAVSGLDLGDAPIVSMAAVLAVLLAGALVLWPLRPGR